MTQFKLKEFIQKNKSIANQNVRCGSCSNILQHCGKYSIVYNEPCNCESIICETCKNNFRIPKKATKIDGYGNVLNFAIPSSSAQQQIQQSKTNFRDQFKKVNKPELTNEERQALKAVREIMVNQQQVQRQKEKEKPKPEKVIEPLPDPELFNKDKEKVVENNKNKKEETE